MSITTRKFSEFVAGSLNNANKKVGLSDGINAIFDDVTSWTTATRPTTPTNGLLGYNSDLQSYEFYDTVAGAWTQLEDSTDIATLLALLASHTASEGASLIGLEDQGSISNKTVQDFNEATFIAQTDNGTLPNAQFLDALTTGIVRNTTSTGVLSIDAPVTAFSNLTFAADKLPYSTGSASFALTDLTAFARTLLDDANAATAAATLAVLPLAGGTMSGNIDMGTNKVTNAAAPTLGSDYTTKNYVDNIVENTHVAADLASTANFAYTYDNGSSGVGATLTAGGNGVVTMDGQSVVLNDRVIFKDQTNGFENGVYDCTTEGTVGATAVFTRATDYDEAGDMQAGDKFAIVRGTANAATEWMMTQTSAITVGTTDITFAEMAQAGALLQSQNLADVDSASTSRTNLGLGSIATQDANNVAITGGAIDGTTIGGTTPAVGDFTQVNVDNLRLDGNTLSSTDTNGDIILNPDGTGDIDASTSVIKNVTDPSSAQDAATKNYVDNSAGGSVGLLSNILFNSTFVISQLNSKFTAATPVANNDATYLVDGWVHLSDGNDIVEVQQNLTGIPASWGGNRYECLVATANKQFGAVQFVESLTPQSPIFQSENFTALVAADLPGTAVTIDSIRFAIIEWTGTANAVTRDPITTWATGATLPTLATNWAYVASSAEITLDSTSRVYKITGTTTASGTNIALIWWCADGNATVGDQLAISGAWLFSGDVTDILPADATAVNALDDNFLPTVTIHKELAAAQRYFQKTFNQSVAVQANSASSPGVITYKADTGSTSNNWILCRLPVTMRTTPTLTGYNRSGTGAFWYNHNKSANSGAFSTQYIGDSSVTLYNGQVVNDDSGNLIVVHATFDARM